MSLVSLLHRSINGLIRTEEEEPPCQCHRYGLDVGRQRDSYVSEYGRVLRHLMDLGHIDFVAESLDRAQARPTGRVADLAWEAEVRELNRKRRLSVECPLCGAPPEEPCVIVPGHKTSGQPLPGGEHHKARYRNADHIFYDKANRSGSTGSTHNAQEG